MAGVNSITHLLTTYTKDYKGPISSGGLNLTLFNPNRPIFWRQFVPLMIRDPHISYGLEILKGPIISKAKFEVECDDMEIAEYVQSELESFWMRGCSKALDCLAWGYSGHEIIYDFNVESGLMEFKDLKFIHPRDVKAVTRDGELVAIEIKRALKEKSDPIYIEPPKCLWLVHDDKYNQWYGRSRLEGSFNSWWQMWKPKGYLDLRHMWFHRYAYEGGILYYPDGTTQDPETGVEIPNAVVATELLDRKESGSSLALPQKTGENRDWEWEAPKGNQAPEGILEYGDILRDEMWEGMGVPPEVAKQEGTGSFAGRRVPQQAFYSMLQEIANLVAFSFDAQSILPRVRLSWGQDAPRYKINPISILQTLQEEEMGAGGEEGGGMEEEQQFDEEGNPIETEDSGDDPLSNGRVEDRDSNAFNMQEKAMKKNGKSKANAFKGK